MNFYSFCMWFLWHLLFVFFLLVSKWFVYFHFQIKKCTYFHRLWEKNYLWMVSPSINWNKQKKGHLQTKKSTKKNICVSILNGKHSFHLVYSCCFVCVCVYWYFHVDVNEWKLIVEKRKYLTSVNHAFLIQLE